MIRVSEREMELVGSDVDLLAELSGVIHVLYGQLKKHYGEKRAAERIDYAVKLAKKDDDEINQKANEIKGELKGFIEDIIKDMKKEMNVGG